MATKVVHFSLPRSVLTFDESDPVKVAPNGVQYMDVRALGFYAGEHKGFVYSQDHIKQLEDSFSAPSEELFGQIPLMCDHSYSNRDKVGHLRAVRTVGSNSEIIARVVGEDAIKAVKEGKFRTLSAGIAMSYDPDDDPEDPEEDDEDEDTDPFSESGDEESEEDMSWADYCKSFKVAYDHMAFTPFPALPDCKTYKRSAKTMSDVKKLAKEKTMEELRLHAATLEADLAAEKAARQKAETEKSQIEAQSAAEKAAIERKFASEQKAEALVREGKISPAQKPFIAAFMASLDDEQLAIYEQSMAVAPKVVLYGVDGCADTRRPEEQNPLAANDQQSAANAKSRARELLIKYSQAGSHATQRERILSQESDQYAKDVLRGSK